VLVPARNLERLLPHRRRAQDAEVRGGCPPGRGGGASRRHADHLTTPRRPTEHRGNRTDRPAPGRVNATGSECFPRRPLGLDDARLDGRHGPRPLVGLAPRPGNGPDARPRLRAGVALHRDHRLARGPEPGLPALLAPLAGRAQGRGDPPSLTAAPGHCPPGPNYQPSGACGLAGRIETGERPTISSWGPPGASAPSSFGECAVSREGRRAPMADVITAEAATARDVRPIRKVPDPFPRTMAGMMAMLGPQAINFGISVGGGEAYLLPNIGARGTFNMHWLMVVSVVLEAALVYECIKYSMNTGRSFFAATADLGPKGFWPWYWAIITLLVSGWPAWMGGAVIAAERFTGISTQTLFPGSTMPPQYIWAVIA